MIYDEASDSYVPAPKDMIKTIVDRIVPADIYLEIRSDVIEFIDSSEMIPQIWVDLAKFVGENIESYDGILITHGTDTMHYT